MREIKFRAWSKEKNAFIAGFNMVGFHSYYNKGIEPTIEPTVYRYGTKWKLSEIILMQFTGLKDKNGKDIYDGDKVKRRVVQFLGDNSYADFTCKVEWNGWCYGLCVHDKQLWGLDPITAKECEVVGNIYESSELIPQ